MLQRRRLGRKRGRLEGKRLWRSGFRISFDRRRSAKSFRPGIQVRYSLWKLKKRWKHWKNLVVFEGVIGADPAHRIQRVSSFRRTALRLATRVCRLEKTQNIRIWGMRRRRKELEEPRGFRETIICLRRRTDGERWESTSSWRREDRPKWICRKQQQLGCILECFGQESSPGSEQGREPNNLVKPRRGGSPLFSLKSFAFLEKKKLS